MHELLNKSSQEVRTMSVSEVAEVTHLRRIRQILIMKLDTEYCVQGCGFESSWVPKQTQGNVELVLKCRANLHFYDFMLVVCSLKVPVGAKTWVMLCYVNNVNNVVNVNNVNNHHIIICTIMCGVIDIVSSSSMPSDWIHAHVCLPKNILERAYRNKFEV